MTRLIDSPAPRFLQKRMAQEFRLTAIGFVSRIPLFRISFLFLGISLVGTLSCQQKPPPESVQVKDHFRVNIQTSENPFEEWSFNPESQFPLAPIRILGSCRFHNEVFPIETSLPWKNQIRPTEWLPESFWNQWDQIHSTCDLRLMFGNSLGSTYVKHLKPIAFHLEDRHTRLKLLDPVNQQEPDKSIDPYNQPQWMLTSSLPLTQVRIQCKGDSLSYQIPLSPASILKLDPNALGFGQGENPFRSCRLLGYSNKEVIAVSSVFTIERSLELIRVQLQGASMNPLHLNHKDQSIEIERIRISNNERTSIFISIDQNELTSMKMTFFTGVGNHGNIWPTNGVVIPSEGSLNHPCSSLEGSFLICEVSSGSHLELALKLKGHLECAGVPFDGVGIRLDRNPRVHIALSLSKQRSKTFRTLELKRPDRIWIPNSVTDNKEPTYEVNRMSKCEFYPEAEELSHNFH